jgi:hypothetical protein
LESQFEIELVPGIGHSMRQLIQISFSTVFSGGGLIPRPRCFCSAPYRSSRAMNLETHQPLQTESIYAIASFSVCTAVASAS